MPYLYSRMSGSLPCRCDRGERQRQEDEYAKLLGRKPKAISHGSQCPIVLAHRLKEVEKKLDALSVQPSLPDPVCEAIDAERRADLNLERERLRKRLRQWLEADALDVVISRL